MGASNSKLEKQLGALPEGERYFGLENFGNTCYCNSVLQTLYFCRPFRDRLLTYAATASRDSEENILTCLADLFVQISTQRKKTGVISPKRFVQRLKREKEQFRSYDEHQDAHELLLDLLNEISELLEAEAKAKQLPAAALPAAAQLHPLRRGAAAAAVAGTTADTAPSSSQPSASTGSAGGGATGGSSRDAVKTWVHELFQGKEVHETRCLQCETVTTSENVFYHLSLAITQNCSLTSCLRNFSSTDTLQGEEKFFCNECGCLQEAQKRTKLKELPRVLFLHLNRFKYTTHMDRDSYVRVQRSKLMYRVVFPFELKLRDSAADDCADPDAEYHLFAVIVHVGSGLDHGHYVALVKSHNTWLFFEDDSVEPITEAMVQSTFGSTQEFSGHVGHGYILMYEKQPQSS